MHLENTSARYTVVNVPILKFFPIPFKKSHMDTHK